MSIKENQLAELAAQLDKCSSCHLRGDCQAPVGWYGCPDSPIVFIGEGPGGVEDDYGCPLIGPSGQLLDKALWSVQMTRDRVLTTNIVKCRPKGNRTPDLAEADFCAKIWLERELAILQPKVIVALGSVAMHYLGDPAMHLPPLVHFASVRTRPGTGQVGRVPRSAAGPGQSDRSLPGL